MQKERKGFANLLGHPFLRLLAGATIILFAILLSDIPMMIMSKQWPATKGVIIKSRRVGTGVRGWDGEVLIETNAFISYRFFVNGTSYTSSAVNSIKSPFALYPRSYASKYPAGKDVTVYYNPKDPSDAVLEPGFVDTFKAFDVFSYVFFGVGIYYIYRGLSSIQRKRY